MNLFIALKKSLYNFDEYVNLIKISNFKTFLYTIILALFFSLTLLSPLTISYVKMGGTSKIIEKYIPDFKIENNLLSVNKVIDYDSANNNIKILVDTQNEYNISDFSDFSNVILFSSNKVTLKSFDLIKDINISDLSSVLNIFSKEDLINNSNFIKNTFYYFVSLIFCLSLIFSHIIVIFITLILTFIIKILFFSDKNLNLSFSERFKLATFANTMPFLLNLILTILGLYMPSFIYLGMFWAITYFAVKEIKLSYINKT